MATINTVFQRTLKKLATHFLLTPRTDSIIFLRAKQSFLFNRFYFAQGGGFLRENILGIQAELFTFTGKCFCPGDPRVLGECFEPNRLSYPDFSLFESLLAA